MAELLSCPFCGAPGHVFDNVHPHGGEYWVAECSADCEMTPTCTKWTEAEAIAAWNRRAPSSELLKLREAVKPFVNFYEQARRVKGDLSQSFCDIETGTSASLAKRHFAQLARLTEEPARSLQSHTGEA